MKTNLLTALVLSVLVTLVFAKERFSREPLASGQELNFQKVRGEARMGAAFGPTSGWDDWVTCPTVVFDGKTYRMWYSSQYESKDGPRGVGLATSVDGVNWQRANDGKQVLTVGQRGSFDWAQILSPEVVFDGRRYLMWYTGIDGSKSSNNLELERIGLATSTDGIHWERANDGKPVIELGPSGSYDDVQVAYPSVIREGNHYRMWYSAYAIKPDHRIVAARSSDGIHWERENQGNPVMGLSPTMAYAPGVTRWRGKYLMFYTGWYPNAPGWGIYGAVSSDGIHWQMINDGRMVISYGTDADFDKDDLSHPFVLNRKDRLLLWYTGTNGREPYRFTIGFAKMVSKDAAGLPGGICRLFGSSM